MRLQGTRRFYSESPAGLETLELLAEHLLSFLEAAAYVDDEWDPGGPILVEAKETVARIEGMKIEIYSNEHPPPHFHVVAPDYRASFTLDSCRLIEGSMPSRQRRKVEYWFHKMNAKAALVSVWNRTRPENCVVGEYKGSVN